MAGGGGVGFYIHNSYPAKLNKTLSPFHENIFECLTIDLKIKSKNFSLTSLYRPPSTNAALLENFFDCYDNLLTNMSRGDTNYFIFTDANFNLLKLNHCKNAQKYLEITHNNGFLQLISKATRIQPPSYSLMDHILTKKISSDDNKIGVITEDISDHFLTFLTLSDTPPAKKHREVSKRDFSAQNVAGFSEALSNINFASVLTYNDVDGAFEEFWTTFSSLFDLYFPLKTEKFNKNNHKINKFKTNGLLISRNNKNKLHKLSILEPSPHNVNTYKTYRNLYNTLIRKS